MNEEFKRELTSLLNRYSIDDKLDTPDYVLTEYIMANLSAANNLVHTRDFWFDDTKKNISNRVEILDFGKD